MRQARIDSEGLKSQASPFRGGRVAYPNAAIAVGSMLIAHQLMYAHHIAPLPPTDYECLRL